MSQQPKRCAFLTSEGVPSELVHDHLTYPPLRRSGWEVEVIPWTTPTPDWHRFDAVVIRSTWDYHRQLGRFLDVLGAIEQGGARLFNPADVCRWNAEKTYLRDLEQAGIPVVPTDWLSRLTPAALAECFARHGAGRLVVKPTVGASAEDTFPLSRDDEPGWAEALRAFADRPVMVQPFVDSIANEGEYSLFYFGGEFSHAIRKVPRVGDFRVQEEYGGRLESVTPPEELRATGERAARFAGEELLYARADLVRLEDGALAVMELELIEPSLYFAFDEASPGRFAAALDRLAT